MIDDTDAGKIIGMFTGTSVVLLDPGGGGGGGTHSDHSDHTDHTDSV